MNSELVGKKVSINGGGSVYLVRAVTIGGEHAILSLKADPEFITMEPIEALLVLDDFVYDHRPCPKCGQQTVFSPSKGLTVCHNTACGTWWDNKQAFIIDTVERKIKEREGSRPVFACAPEDIDETVSFEEDIHESAA